VEFSTENHDYPPTSKGIRSKSSLIQWRFKIRFRAESAADEYFRPLHVIEGFVSVWTIKSGLECGQWVLRKQRITVLMQKSFLPNSVAECFRPLHTCIGVVSVRKIEKGLECCQWLLRKLKITVTGAKLLHVHSVY
jgi:hypothetical protein